MPRQTSQVFPRDEEGTYLTLDVLRRFKNAETVSIQSVQVGNHTTNMVPHLHSVDDSQTTLCYSSSPIKVYFKALADVKITYQRPDGHVSTSPLQHIKDRGFSQQAQDHGRSQSAVTLLPFQIIADFVQGTEYYLAYARGDLCTLDLAQTDFEAYKANGGATFNFPYKNACHCNLVFSSTIHTEPDKTFALHHILNKSRSLASHALNIADLRRVAVQAKLTLKQLHLINRAAATDPVIIDLATTSETPVHVPNTKHSYFTYEANGSAQKILVENFLNRGFPVTSHEDEIKFIKHMAAKSKIQIKYLTKNNARINLEYATITNRVTCEIHYKIPNLDVNFSISLQRLHELNKFPREKTLTIEDLQQCRRFFDVQLTFFQTDTTSRPVPFDSDSPATEYPYLNQKLCFVFYTYQAAPHKVRLDHLLDRGCFPHLAPSATQPDNNQQGADKQHAPAHRFNETVPVNLSSTSADFVDMEPLEEDENYIKEEEDINVIFIKEEEII